MSVGIEPSLIAIDDDRDSAELIVRVARKAGYSGAAMTNPRNLIQVLKQSVPSVITLDLSMDEVNGLEALDVLQNAGFRGKLIIISGHRQCLRDNVSKWATAYGLHVSGNLQKPISVQVLQNLLLELRATITDPSGASSMR